MMKNRDIGISMIMPNHNGARYLAKSIGAFLAQSYDNKELLIVDGRSKDDSHDIIATVCGGNSCVRWLRYEDSGISDATNFGIQRARGDVIGYLGSDDMLLNEVLQKVAELSAYIDFDGLFFKSFTYFVRERHCVVQRPVTTEITIGHLEKYRWSDPCKSDLVLWRQDLKAGAGDGAKGLFRYEPAAGVDQCQG